MVGLLPRLLPSARPASLARRVLKKGGKSQSECALMSLGVTMLLCNRAANARCRGDAGSGRGAGVDAKDYRGEQ